MTTLRIWILGLAALLGSRAGAADAHLRFVYRASETANLGRHLDCLAEVGFCDRDAYQEAWKAGWSAEDDAAIAEWKRLVERSPHAQLFVLVARNNDELARLADELVALPRVSAGFVPLFDQAATRVKPVIH